MRGEEWGTQERDEGRRVRGGGTQGGGEGGGHSVDILPSNIFPSNPKGKGIRSKGQGWFESRTIVMVAAQG